LVLGTGGDAEADANLAVGDFSRRAGVLSLHSHRMLALFEEAGVVDNPGFHGLALRHGGEGVPGGLPAYIPVAPHGIDGEGTPAALLSQDVADPSEILLEPLNPPPASMKVRIA
jgi:hypothetical protein